MPAVNNGGNIRNLGTISAEELSNLETFLFHGPLEKEGMPDFTGKLTADQAEKIKAFIVATAEANSRK